MKKVLSKMSVMITFVVLAVALLGVYVGLLARPVATGMGYTETRDKEEVVKNYESYVVGITADMFNKLKVKQTVVFTSSKTCKTSLKFDYEYSNKVTPAVKMAFDAIVTSAESGVDDSVSYYYRSGYKIYNLYTATEKTYDDAVKALKARDGWEDDYDLSTNAFVIRAHVAENYKGHVSSLVNVGTIVITVVLGAVVIALIAFAGLSVSAYTNRKKRG